MESVYKIIEVSEPEFPPALDLVAAEFAFQELAAALLLPMTVSAKEAVTRPAKVQGHVTMGVSLVDRSFVSEDWEQSAHFGRYTNEGSGQMDLQTGDGWGSGIVTAANGDQLFWDATVEHDVSVVTFTGGAGRFEGATGRFIPVSGLQDVTVDPGTMTMTFKYIYTGRGTITY